MKVAKIKIDNILGIEHLEFEPGKFTAVTGSNGEGKTSVLEAIKAALKGGHDATLLRNGAERGEVVLILDDGSRISKTVFADRSKQRFVDGFGEAEGRAPTTIKDLTDAISVNPIEFLTGDKKKQVAALLDAMPLKADLARLTEINGAPVAEELKFAHALGAIEQVRRDIYDARTGVNVALKQKEGTIAQLEKSIPSALADVDAVDETALEFGLADADAVRDAELSRIDVKLQGMEAEWSARLDDLQKQIDAVKSERERIRTAADKQRTVARERWATDRRPFEDKLSIIRANRDAAAKARATRETVDTMRAELDELRTQSEDATARIERLDAYKLELLSALPIPGLRIEEGEIYFGDVLFERLNTKERMRVAVDIAKLRAGKLGFICVDGVEAFDAEGYAAFRDAILECDDEIQLLVTRVGDGPLNVRAEQ